MQPHSLKRDWLRPGGAGWISTDLLPSRIWKRTLFSGPQVSPWILAQAHILRDSWCSLWTPCISQIHVCHHLFMWQYVKDNSRVVMTQGCMPSGFSALSIHTLNSSITQRAPRTATFPLRCPSHTSGCLELTEPLREPICGCPTVSCADF